MRNRPRRTLTLTTILATTALLAGACGSSGSGEPADSGGPIELTIATFGEFGYEELLREYQTIHPNIKVTERKTGKAGPHHQNLIAKLGAGSGLADIEAIEEGHLSNVLDKASRFNDLSQIGPADAGADRWLPWKYEAAKSKDGKLIGYGTDSGPLAMCYRKDLLEAANMPSDPQSVKALFSTWETYFQAGQEYVQKSGGKPWFDSAAQNFNAMVNQQEVGYLDRNDKLTLDNNAGIKKAWDQVTAAVGQGQSAKLTAFSNEWNSGFKEGAFATKSCPAWMIGVIKEQSGPDNAGKWAVTDAFPGGGGNWGGSYLSVPTQTKHPKEAAELAAWLTAPEQQLKAFEAKGTFPSQVKALESPRLAAQTEPFFAGEPKIGELFAAQARKIAQPQYKGPGDGQIQENVSTPALQAVEQGTAPAQGWQQLVDGAKKIVG
ncbi:extracellular solute-binding protein [Amycolatopsis sp. YIM 10]|uniref:ABC transporter substrate-binding protein n=1 Tax=Amycolatopsis sp. YIM 10 TaxID=2653857 RepID=UPI00351A0466